jgi:hypothetical protein
MRSALLCLCLLAALPAHAGAPAPAPSSAANLVRLHPGPWRFPARAPLAAMRFEPERGEAASAVAGASSIMGDEAALRARAEAGVRTLPDGSRHAVLGGAIRAWTVATIDDQGRLVQDCVQGGTEARQRVEAAARKQVRK